jgi:hypothetical protein
VDGRPVRRPLLVQTYASTLQLENMKRVRHELIFDLYRPTGTPRLRLLAAGRYADKWLAPRGAITVWTKHAAKLELVLSMPEGSQVTPLKLNGRTVTVKPGERVPLTFRVPAGRPWSLHFSSSSTGYVGERAVSVLADSIRLR